MEKRGAGESLPPGQMAEELKKSGVSPTSVEGQEALQTGARPLPAQGGQPAAGEDEEPLTNQGPPRAQADPSQAKLSPEDEPGEAHPGTSPGLGLKQNPTAAPAWQEAEGGQGSTEPGLGATRLSANPTDESQQAGRAAEVARTVMWAAKEGAGEAAAKAEGAKVAASEVGQTVADKAAAAAQNARTAAAEGGQAAATRVADAAHSVKAAAGNAGQAAATKAAAAGQAVTEGAQQAAAKVQGATAGQAAVERTSEYASKALAVGKELAAAAAVKTVQATKAAMEKVGEAMAAGGEGLKAVSQRIEGEGQQGERASGQQGGQQGQQVGKQEQVPSKEEQDSKEENEGSGSAGGEAAGEFHAPRSKL